MIVSKVLLNDLITNHIKQENGLNEVLEFTLNAMREDVAQWNARPLEARYPVIFIDALWVNVRRDSVAKEAFYVVLGVKEDRTREVLAISHQPTESAIGWQMLLEGLHHRGLQPIGLVVADGLKGL